MKKSTTQVQRVLKTLLLMKLSFILVLLGTVASWANGYGQGARVSISKHGSTLEQLFLEIEQKTPYRFVYSASLLQGQERVDVDVANTPVAEVLAQVLKPAGLVYDFRNNYLIVVRKDEAQPTIRLVRGRVRNEDGQPMAGVSVSLRNSRTKTTTDGNGLFILEMKKKETEVHFSYVGYAPLSYPLDKADTTGNSIVVEVQLRSQENALNEVVVTGITTRNKESFTGAANSFSGEELKMVGNQNLIQSLKSLDPSFIVLENNVQGSNPNSLPSIEVRGKTSINSVTDAFSADPNLPLFVLDGFETSLQAINDLDMNRVASVTILKDASSTAIYGAKAANGVVVVETLRPEPGEIRLSYTNDSRIEFPDLSSYNMMNATEKLEFERLAGRYRGSGADAQFALDDLYNARLKSVLEGVDTYWLKEPIQTGFTHGHALRATGGDQSLQFAVGVTYRSIAGAMKGSDRDTWSGNADLTYRRNKLNITNQLYVSGYNADDSPYGSFSNFVNANPYYRKYDENGNIQQNLDNTIGLSYLNDAIVTPNPLWNAMLVNIANSKSLEIRDNLRFIYTLSRVWRFEGALQIARTSTETTSFKDPQHTDFISTETLRKGAYSNQNTYNDNASANIMATYANAWKQHQLTVNLRGDIQQVKNRRIGLEAEGFPFGTNGDPSFAYSYKQNSSPISAVSDYRRANLLASANYNYDMRYLLDLNYRLDGSTAFGSAKRYSPFASIGLGWNIHREPFMKDVEWLNLWKLRGNIGTTGNQNLGSTTSVSIYSYASGSNVFGQYLDMTSLGNPDLAWQKTIQTSVGTDLTLLNNRFTATLNYYNKATDPLIVNITLPSSVGVSSLASNVGKLNIRGYEADLRYFPIRDLARRVLWNIGVFGSVVRGKYSNFGTALSHLNEEQLSNNSLIRYHDGYNPDDIWAVISRGIDPATGQEIFLKKDGTETFTYSSDDIVKVGNSRPLVEGVISTNLTVRSFSAGLSIRYRVGGDLFNSALYNKVENISLQGLINNQDRRALYDRWQNVGDVSQFKSISLSSTTPMSSRFVQRNNQLVGESIRLGWQFQQEEWVRKLKMQQLRFNVYVNDIFRLATTKDEKGTSYPFTRTVSFSINASF